MGLLSSIGKVAGGLLGGITPLLGPVASLFGGAMAREGQQDTNVANAQQAADQMAFQERMSNSAHQREVNDLRAAGLNPILSGTGGAGASAPPGAAARMENEDAIGVNTALQANMNLESVKNLKETNKQISADTDLKHTQRTYTSQLWNSARAQERLTNQQTATEEHRTEQAKQEASILGNTAKGYELEGDIDSTTYGKVMRYINRAQGAVGTGSSAFRNFKPTFHR